jgi:hypothetical protein
VFAKCKRRSKGFVKFCALGTRFAGTAKTALRFRNCQNGVTFP